MYGPWIREFVHGNRPEIHPSDLLWFKEEDPWGRESYMLMVVQDDSNRFDSNGIFAPGIVCSFFPDLPMCPPDNWKRWATAPIPAEFRIAFEVDLPIVIPPPTASKKAPLPQLMKFYISELGKSHVITGSDPFASQDSDDGRVHALEFNGHILVEVVEEQTDDDHLGVGFVNVCRTDEGTLKGYIYIRTTVGKGDDGDEGFHVIRVSKGEKPPTPPPPLPPCPPQVDPSFCQPSLPRLVNLGDLMGFGKGGLLGDICLDITPPINDFCLPPIVAFADIGRVFHYERTGKRVRRKRLKFEQLPIENNQGVRVHLKDVRINGGGQFVIMTKSGEVLSTNDMPGLALGLWPVKESKSLIKGDPTVWNTMAVLAGGKPATTVGPPAQLMRVQEKNFEVAPIYFPLKSDGAYPEDEWPVAEVLNEALSQRDPEEMKRFFGSTQPLKISWRFKARNLTTGKSVRVEKGSQFDITPKDGGIVRVELLQGKLPNDTIKITFPEKPEDAIYELVATVTIKDTLRTKRIVSHKVYSHILMGEDETELADAVLSAVANLAGVSPGDLFQASVGIERPLPPDDPRIDDPVYRRARMVRSFALHAAEDKHITVDELRSLISGARLYGSQQ